MRTNKLIYAFNYILIAGEQQLNDSQRRAIEAAKEAIAGSYAPYSDFHVGSAVILQDGRIVAAANQENAAYPSGLCAERNALFSAMAQIPRQTILTIAIAAKSHDTWTQNAITPCGACRQVIVEYAKLQKQPVEVIMWGEKETIIIPDARDLLPFSFEL